MTIREIMKRANFLADEEYDVDILSGFVLDAVSKFNMDWPAVVAAPDIANLDSRLEIVKEVTPADPSNITPEETQRITQMKTINDMFINKLIIPYVTYLIKVNDADQAGYTDRLYEWSRSMERIKGTYGRFLKDEYKLESIEETQNTTGRVAFRNPTNVTYGNYNTFGSSPTGNQSKAGYNTAYFIKKGAK